MAPPSAAGGLGIGLATLLTLSACQREQKQPEVRATAARPTAGAPAAAAVPWFVGRWAGSYEAHAVPLTLPVREAEEEAWAGAGGATGSGQITLQIDAQGRSTGESSGALGPAVLRGQVHDERIALSFQANDQTERGFTGTLLLTQDGQNACRGTLQASTGDSLILRKAEVSLRRQRE